MCPDAVTKIGIDQFNYNPQDEYWGFTSWNDFFTRTFKEGERPVAGPTDEKIIVSACESSPYCIQDNVNLKDTFWIKSQPYSLIHLLNNDSLASQFEGGTIYQAFLSAYNFHRWNSPVSGVVEKAFVVDGSYYSEAKSESFDPEGPNNSQGYIAHTATRAIIFIRNPTLGLVGFVAIGMAEVSSNILSVRIGQEINKGDELGYFQFGGSTHCLLFQKDVILSFVPQAKPKNSNSVNVMQVNSHLATAK
jgi:phosphatidylserine decarboxylase